MTRGVKPYHNRTNKGLLQLFLCKRLTIESMANILDVSISTAQSYINCPYNMRLKQLSLLSGYLDTPLLELVATVHLNTKKLNPIQSASLADIVKKVEENK